MTTPPRPGLARPIPGRPSGARPGGSAPPSIDPVRILRQHVGGIIIATAIGAVVSVAFYFGSYYTYPLYDSQSVFEVRNRLVDPRDVRSQEFTDEETVARLCTQEARRVSTRQAMLAAIQGKAAIINTNWIKAYPDDSGGINWEDAIDDLEKEVRSGHLRGTQQFYVAWRAHTDEDVIAVLHALEEYYLKEKRAEDQEEDRQKRAIFDAQLQRVEGEISTAQTDIEQLIGTSNLQTFDESEQQAMKTLEDIEVRMNETAQQMKVLQSRSAEADAKLQSRRGWSQDDRAKVQTNPVLMELRTQWATYETQLAAARARFAESHPRLDELRRLEEAAKSQYTALEATLLQDEVAGEKAIADAQLKGLESVMKDLGLRQDDERKRLNTAAQAVSRLREIRDRKERLEEEAKLLQSQIVSIDLVLERPDAETVRRVQSALKPRELWFPQLKVVIPGVTLLIVGLYVAWIFLREFTDKRVRFPADLAALPSAARLLGVIPDEEGDPDAPDDLARAVDVAPNGYLAECYRQTFALIARGLSVQDNVVVALVSPIPSAGVTSCATNLALIARTIGKRVLLVEANLRRPGIAAALESAADAKGLGDLLNSGAPAADCIQTLPDGIDVMTAGSPGARGLERLYTSAFRQAIDSLRPSYDIILLDVPPSVIAGEAITIAQAADASVLVAHAYSVEKGLVQKLASQLSELGNQFLGAILFANRTTAGGYQRKNVKLLASYTESAEPAEVPSASGA